MPVLRDHLYHPANGGKRNAREGARLKRMGVRAGVSDYHLPIARGGYHGLWVELKAGRGKPTVSQVDWLQRMRDAGHDAHVATGWIEAKLIIERYLNG